MIVIEGLIIVGSVIGIVGLHNGLRRLGVVISKNKLKKLLIRAFDILDYDLIKKAISGLQDFDYKHNTKKLDKYILPIIKEFREDENKLSINERNLHLSFNDFSLLPTIFDEDDEEEEEQLNVVDEGLGIIDIKLQDVKKRRDEIIQRKNHIRAIQRQQKKRAPGSMG